MCNFDIITGLITDISEKIIHKIFIISILLDTVLKLIGLDSLSKP